MMNGPDYNQHLNLRWREVDGGLEIFLITEGTIPNAVNRSQKHWSSCEGVLEDPEGLLEPSSGIRLELDSTLSSHLGEFREAIERERGQEENYTHQHLRAALRGLDYWGKQSQAAIEIIGAHGELHLLHLLLLLCDGDPAMMHRVLEAWQRFDNATFDFVFVNGILEVKTTAGTVSREHSFSSHHQVNPPGDLTAHLASLSIKRDVNHPTAETLWERIEQITSVLSGTDDASAVDPDNLALVTEFEEIIAQSEILEHQDATIPYRINPNMPLKIVDYSDVPGIESIQEHYDGHEWVESPHFSLADAPENDFGTVALPLLQE